MNSKQAGRLFLTIVLCYVAVELVLLFTPLREQMGEVALMAVSELILIIPGLIFFMISRQRPGEVFAIRGIRPVLIPLCIVFTYLVTPLTATLNMFTLYFTDNQATAIFDELSGAGIGVLALFVAVIAPICEELTFRGILYTGFRKNGSAMQAVILTALLFGLFHMNINQMLYAAALGLFFAALREVTGSVLPSIICHMTVNGSSTLVLLLGGGNTEELSAASSELLTTENITIALSFFIIAAFVGVALALCMLIYIARLQGGSQRLSAIITERKSGAGRVAGVPLAIGMAICVIFIVGLLILQVLSAAIFAAA